MPDETDAANIPFDDREHFERTVSEGLPYEARKSRKNVPVVTVFGGGVAGLTAAHELIQRGFLVQVVEREASQDVEYACEVGGLARSQPKRIRSTRRPHWMLYNKQSREEYVAANASLRNIEDEGLIDGTLSEDEREANLATIRAIRDRPMQPVQKRYPISQRITLLVRKADDNPAKQIKQDAESKVSDEQLLDADELLALYGIDANDAWAQIENIPDWNGEIQALIGQAGPNYLNGHKLDAVCCQLFDAAIEYRKHLRDDLDALREAHGRTYDLDPCVARREALLVEVHGRCDFFKSRRKNVAAARAWAHVIKNKIVKCIENAGNSGNDALKARVDELANDSDVEAILKDTLENFADHLICRGSAPRPAAASDGVVERRLRMNIVEFNVIEHVVMGEHGFRFFPGFYRHLFDTMRRTPVLDARWVETGRTVFDELIEPPPVRIGASGGGSYRQFDHAEGGSLEQLRRQLEYISDGLDFSLRDQLRYQVQVLKFMTSCEARRQLYEKFSWMEFVDGKSEYANPDPEGALNTSGYSEAGGKLVREIPQLLVAMSADETDALTNGTVSVQMMLDALQSGRPIDRMLNGPTSTAWLQHWKRYLTRQGVRFFRGRLDHLQFVESELVPVATGDGPCGKPQPENPYDRFYERPRDYEGSSAGSEREPTPDFYIYALPYALATEYLWDVDQFELKYSSALRLKSIWQQQPRLTVSDAERSDVEDAFWLTALIKAVDELRAALEFSDAQVRYQLRSDAGPTTSATARLARGVSQPRSAPAISATAVHATESLKSDLEEITNWRALSKVDPLVDTIEAEINSDLRDAHNVNVLRTRVREIRDRVHVTRFLPAGMLQLEVEISRVVLGLEPQPTLPDLGAYLIDVAESRARALSRLDGDFARLLDFDRHANRRDALGQPVGRDPPDSPYGVERDVFGLPQPQFRFPLRDLNGVQYYFRELVRIGYGHFVLPQSAWGISGVGQIFIGRRRPWVSRGYLGQLSIDIGNFYRPYTTRGGNLRLSAWQSSPVQLATYSWNQLIEVEPREYRQRVTPPRYYQIDDGLIYGPSELSSPELRPWRTSYVAPGVASGRDTLVVNQNMLMINLPGQWEYRPGLQQLDDNSREVRYQISNSRWVMAGNFMATHTRLTTMESANESGRHASNAIIDELLGTRLQELYNGGGTSLGDVVDIWNPADHEIPDLAPFKRLDAALFDRRIPHFLDVLEIPEAIDRLPIRDDPNDRPVFNLTQLIENALQQPAKDWEFLRGYADLKFAGFDALLSQLKKLTELSSESIDVIVKNMKNLER